MTGKSAVDFECCNRFVRVFDVTSLRVGGTWDMGTPAPTVFATPLQEQEIQTGRPPWEGGRQKHWFEKNTHLHVKFTTKGGISRKTISWLRALEIAVRTSPPNVRILRISIKQSTLLCVMAVTGFVSYTPVFVSYTSRHCDQGVPRQLRLSFLPPLPPVTAPACNRCPSRRTCAPPRARRE